MKGSNTVYFLLDYEFLSQSRFSRGKTNKGCVYVYLHPLIYLSLSSCLSICHSIFLPISIYFSGFIYLPTCLPVYLEVECYFNELAHVTVEADKTKACRQAGGRQAGRLETRERVSTVAWVQTHLEAEFSLLTGTSVFSQSSTDWMKPTHITEGHWLCSKSANLHSKHI